MKNSTYWSFCPFHVLTRSVFHVPMLPRPPSPEGAHRIRTLAASLSYYRIYARYRKPYKNKSVDTSGIRYCAKFQPFVTSIFAKNPCQTPPDHLNRVCSCFHSSAFTTLPRNGATAQLRKARTQSYLRKTKNNYASTTPKKLKITL